MISQQLFHSKTAKDRRLICRCKIRSRLTQINKYNNRMKIFNSPNETKSFLELLNIIFSFNLYENVYIHYFCILYLRFNAVKVARF